MINICTSAGDTKSLTHLCEAISALIGENLDLDVAGYSNLFGPMGLHGAVIVFKKK